MPAALLRRLLHLLTADTPALSRPERRRASVGALLSVALSALVLPLVPGAHAWLMAPIGASVVILFALSLYMIPYWNFSMFTAPFDGGLVARTVRLEAGINLPEALA